MYVVVRGDLPVGLAAAQAAHAVAEFMLYNKRHLTSKWREDPYLIILSAEDQQALWSVVSRASIAGIPYVMWNEPDINNETTAVCLAPVPEARQIVGNLPLFGREVVA